MKKKNNGYSRFSIEELTNMLETWKRLRETIQQDTNRIPVYDSPMGEYCAHARYGDMGHSFRDRDMQRINSTINEIEKAIADKRAELESQPQ